MTMESGTGTGGALGLGGSVLPYPVTHETNPPGEVDVHRGDHVHATDGEIGRVQGLVIDRGNRRVTHVLLQEGHLWGRRQVAIPIGAVTSTSDGIQLTITKQEVQDLPPVDTDHPDWGTGGAAGHELGAEAPPGAPADPADRTRHLKAAEPGT